MRWIVLQIKFDVDLASRLCVVRFVLQVSSSFSQMQYYEMSSEAMSRYSVAYQANGKYPPRG